MERVLYGKTADGQEVEGFALRNRHGLEMRCISYGCRLTHLLLPTAEGGHCDILLGFDDLAGYEADTMSHGAIVGRYAGRIGGAGFELNGQYWPLAKNCGEDFLHGSLAHRVFNAQPMGDNSISFTTTSPEGEDGFPGEVWLAITYTLTDENELVVDYRAVSTADTHLNLTNHSYFNLAGIHSGQDALGTLLTLRSSQYVEEGPGLLPTGRLPQVAGTVFDFTAEKPIGRQINEPDPQLQLAGGYDHGFVIQKEGAGFALAAVARHPQSGRSLRVHTTQPEVHLYTGNGLAGTPGKQGLPMEKHSAFCLETQHLPDSMHQPDFPSTLLAAKEKYHQITVFHFGF